jgi:dTDP-4-amino-4,6-dideoxygalactose transaminase
LNYGIRTEIHYSQSANQIFAQINGEPVKTDISESSKLSSETLSLPLSPWMTLEEFDYVEGIILTPEVLESFF